MSVDVSSDRGIREKKDLWSCVVMKCLLEERIVRGDLVYRGPDTVIDT